MEKKYEAERRGHYGGARLAVMQPTVVNENNVPRDVPSENVASHPLSKNEENIYKMLHEFRNWNREWDTFMAKKPESADEFVKHLARRYAVSPIQNVSSEGLVCRNGNPEKYKDCIEMGTTFCHNECEFGAKETKINDVNLDYQREDGK